MNIRTVIVLDWEPVAGWVYLQTLGSHRSLGGQEVYRILGEEDEGPLDAVRDYIEKVQKTEEHWKGIPD